MEEKFPDETSFEGACSGRTKWRRPWFRGSRRKNTAKRSTSTPCWRSGTGTRLRRGRAIFVSKSLLGLINPVVLDNKKDGTYCTRTRGRQTQNSSRSLKKLIEDAIALNDSVESTPSVVSKTSSLEWDYQPTEIEKRGVVDGLRPEEVRELGGALLPNETTLDRLQHLKVLRVKFVK